MCWFVVTVVALLYLCHSLLLVEDFLLCLRVRETFVLKFFETEIKQAVLEMSPL